MNTFWRALIVASSVACSATEPRFDEALQSTPATGLRRSDGCGAPATPLHAVQGDGDVSPLAGRSVSVEGVVTAVFPGSDQLGGFFLQGQAFDDETRTSEGVFVFEGAESSQVEVGQHVRVTGRVSEFYGLTQLNELARVSICGDAESAPVALPWPPASGDAFEAFEGMLVRVASPLTLNDSYRLARFGELSLSPQRHFVASDGAATSSGASLSVDDGAQAERVWPISLLPDAAPPRLGDEVMGLSGVLSYAYGRYVLLPTEPLAWNRRSRPLAPRLSGNFTVAALNLGNYFVTLGARGAAAEAERERQRSKLGALIAGLDADLLALTELENDGGAAAEDLVRAAEQAAPPSGYRVASTPASAGSDAIRSGLLYRPERLAPVAAPELELDPVFRRPPLVQRFDVRGFALTVIVVHLKSKRCEEPSETSCGDAARLAESHALVEIARRRSLEPGTDGVLLLGDFNAYPHEEPIQEIVREGFDEFLAEVPAAERYSYVFDGAAGLLDHAFGSLSLSRRLAGAAIWHVNADESSLLDYRLDNPPELFQPDAFRASDHDPIVLSFDLP
jgi:predicted extracellular nuclease